jgi:hypothetical protein
MDEYVAMLVQGFGQDFVIPHLHWFVAWCHAENVVLPSAPGEPTFLNYNLCLTRSSTWITVEQSRPAFFTILQSKGQLHSSLSLSSGQKTGKWNI